MSFAVPVGMPSVHLHEGEGCQVRDGAEYADPQVRKSGLTLQHGREPECKAIKHEVIEKGYRCEKKNCTGFKRLPDRNRPHSNLLFFMQLLLNPLPVLWSKPGRFAWPIRQEEIRYSAQ